MRILRVAGVMIALAVALAAVPGHADDQGLSLQLSLGWDGGAVAGAWIPYQVTVRNDSATRDFNGSVVIWPRGPTRGATNTGSSFGTTYAQAIAVPHTSSRTLTIYGAYLDVTGGGSGYIAELEDRGGTLITRSPIAVLSSGRLAIGLLSDSLQAAGQIKDAHLQATSTGVAQLTPQTLPGSAPLLSGLGAIVIDNFDSSALSQAQDQALEQYVGLGGQLVLAGGSGWRRTLAQLPAQLVPLRPQGTAAASLDPVLDLLAGHSPLVAPAVVGPLAPGARVVLADAAGIPLLAELNYGAGRVVEVAFDPADEPVASHGEEVRASWAAVLDRVTSAAAGYSRQASTGVILAPAPGQVGVNRGAVDDTLSALLNDTPANALPPLRILGSLLVVYILLAGPINYVLLRRIRRRELTWVTVPLIAVLFTAGSYGAGILVHGRDYFVNEIQVLRVTPGGAVDVQSYDAVFSPSHGDVAVQLPAATLASTYLPVPSGLGQGSDDRVVTGASPVVDLRNVAIWTSRDLKTDATTRGTIAVEAHLRVEQDKVIGTLSNRGRSAIRRLTLLATDGRSASLAPLLAPGSTLSVSAPLRLTSGQAGAAPACQTACADTGSAVAAAPGDRASAVMSAAGGLITSPATEVQALAGIVDGLPGFRVAGGVPGRSLVAAFAMPVTLESVDVLPTGWSAPRLVASNALTGNPVSVVDYELPRMPTSAQLKIGAGNASPIGTPTLPGQKPQVEIFDWSASTWSAADISHPFQLSAGERGPDLVRLRVRGSLYLPGLSITSTGR
jgi:hypothetical protein